MSKDEKNSLLKHIFESRPNCLLLNVSTKNRSDDRCDFPVVRKLLPEFFQWHNSLLETTELPEHTLVSFFCSAGLQNDVVVVEEVDPLLPEFRQVVYLVRSRYLSGINLHLLKTTKSFIDGESMNQLIGRHFTGVCFLDYYPWHRDDFIQVLSSFTVSRSVAVMDGYGNNAYSEINTRPKEIQEIRDYYEKELKMKCPYIKTGALDIFDLAELMGLKPTERTEKNKELKESIRVIANYFINNTWMEIIKFVGLSNLTANGYELSRNNVIEYCFDYSLNQLLNKEEKSLFDKLVSEWKIFFDKQPLLLQYNSIPAKKLEKISEQVGKNFSDYIVKKLKTIIKS